MNHEGDGFDCPGCAWPDDTKGLHLDICENGIKHVTWEMTGKRVDRDFFAAHSVTELSGWSDFDLEDQGRLTERMVYNRESDHYVPIRRPDAFDRPRVEPPAHRSLHIRVGAAGAGFDQDECAYEVGACCGGEHGGVTAQRLPRQDGPVQVELFEDGDDVGGVCGMAHLVRTALAGAVIALVDGDNPVARAQGPS